MKKILVLFLAIVITGTGIGFGAVLNSDTGDPVNALNSGHDYKNNDNTGQNDENNADLDQSDISSNEIDTNEIDDSNKNSHENDHNWYDGFWNNKDHNCWKDKDCDGHWNYHKDSKDKCCDNDEEGCSNDVDIDNEINNYVTVSATGGNAQSNVETGSTPCSRINGIASEIAAYNYNEQEYEDHVPLEKTGLPVVPALLSTLLIGSALLYKKLRN